MIDAAERTSVPRTRPDYARMSPIEAKALVLRAVEDADERATEAAADENAAFQVADEALTTHDKEIRSRQASVNELRTRKEAHRQNRGQLVLDGASTSALDKTVRQLTDELEREEDRLDELTRRRPQLERKKLICGYERVRVRRNAFADVLRDAEAQAAELKARWGVALATADAIRARLDVYGAGMDGAHRAVAGHKQQHPELYQ